MQQLAASVQEELRLQLQPLVEQMVRQSAEICVNLCKGKLSELIESNSDPVFTAVTKGIGPTPEEAAKASARLLVSAALLSSGSGGPKHTQVTQESAEPCRAVPTTARAAGAAKTVAVKAPLRPETAALPPKASKAKVPPKPKAEAKPALAISKPKAKAKEVDPEVAQSGPPSVMSMIRKSLAAPLQRSEPKKAPVAPIAPVPVPKPKAPRSSVAKSPSPESSQSSS